MDHSREFADDVAASALAIAGASLCRVWMIGPGDLCSTCALADECPERRACLHLGASVGLTRRLDGPFRRFPLGAREVGRVARTLEPHVMNEDVERAGLADPGWLALHRITAFGAWPIHRSGECLGVLALFGTRPIDEPGVRALTA